MGSRSGRRHRSGSAGRGSASGGRGYARTVRVNEVLRQVLAETLERMEDIDERLGMLTITAVQCEPDFRRAIVLLSSMSEAEAEALEGARVRLQAAISQEVRLKRTPQLRFQADPAVASGQKIEEIIRGLPRLPGSHEGGDGSEGGDGPDGAGEARSGPGAP